mmetsp:Transcript_10984/g.31523  ORF Transcript_10984/g.31523 Transcript_10984/m.31523 type:complete len:419 (-) Transcript_10984:29-1285(-)
MSIEELIAAKQKAVEEEDFLLAAELKKQIEEAQAAADAENDEAAAAELKAKIEALTLEKKEAVENEDYLRAAELKKEIEELQQGNGSTPAKKSSTTKSTPSKKPTPIKMKMKTHDGPTKSVSTTSTSSVSSNTATSLLSPERKAPRRTSSSTLNPIKADPKLKSLIDELNDVNSVRTFKTWKSSFLNRFEDFLDEAGSQPAQDAYNAFRVSMKKFSSQVASVEQFVSKGDLGVDRTTVKGRNSLNEMNKMLVNIIEEEQQLIPAKSAQEKKRGYTKFHLGAVLVRDGFLEYHSMNKCCEVLTHFKDVTLVGVADKQQIEELENYAKSMKRFRDIMADLGLYEVMLKCWEFGMDNEEFIFVDLKTGAIGGISIKECIDLGYVHTIKNEKTGSDVGFREAITDDEDKEAVLGLVREALKL